jgi:iron(II)-dependent oxidoreductase
MTVDGMQFCYVPPGPFRMGSGEDDDMAYDDEKPLHDQDLDYGYWLGRYPVTAAQFAEYVAASGRQPGDADALNADPNAPVVWISWHEALAFCDWLTARWQERGWLPQGYRVSLPSEAEWEKAARGGLEVPRAPVIAMPGAGAPTADLIRNPMPERRYPWGRDLDPERANYRNINVVWTSTVGAFAGGMSPYGCEEMSGNVREWTCSLWGEYPYPDDPKKRRRREDLNAKGGRVLRGGAFGYGPNGLRCAARGRFFPVSRYDDLGFRVVVSPLL